MLNHLILPNNPPLFQYHQQSFTCDNCQQEFQQSPLYSTAQNKQELGKQKTYCSNCAEPSLSVPTSNGSRSRKKPKPKKNTVAYYQCMSACCQQGISPKKITQIAHECKNNSLGILSQRTSEIQKLNEAYRQIGESLTNLLQPIQ
jgi:hypothetical protein